MLNVTSIYNWPSERLLISSLTTDHVPPRSYQIIMSFIDTYLDVPRHIWGKHYIEAQVYKITNYKVKQNVSVSKSKTMKAMIREDEMEIICIRVLLNGLTTRNGIID